MPHPAYLDLPRSELSRRIDEGLRALECCRVCPRDCDVNRLQDQTAICRAGRRARVSSYFPHFGEEDCLRGWNGSGTIFFGWCNLRCVFCQNWETSQEGAGDEVTPQELAAMMLELQARGCHNINFVTPTHFVPNIVQALRTAIRLGLRIPLVYNCGGYEPVEIVRLLDGIVDIYLPDYKYTDGAMAEKFSSGARDYPEVAAAAIEEMHRQVGELLVDENGIALRGLMIRHLVMPNNIAGTDKFVRWVARRLTPSTYVNIMPQYRPEHRAFEYPEIARPITAAEYRQAIAWAREAGLTRLDRE